MSQQEPIEITPEDSVVPIYLVPLTPEEEAERELMTAEAEARVIAEQELENSKRLAKESAMEKLAALGLTEEEARAIVGV